MLAFIDMSMLFNQAGDLYEKIRMYAEALKCYKKGDNYKRGKTRCAIISKIHVFVVYRYMCPLLIVYGKYMRRLFNDSVR